MVILLKRLKKYRFLIFIAFFLLLGFVSAPLIYSGFFNIYFSSFKIRWYYHIILFLGTLFITLTLHELTHFISFLISGYKVDVIILLFLVFYKDNNKWKMKINFKLLLLGGGMVMPDLGEITSDEDFNKAVKAMRASLLAAPLFSLISGVVLFLITAIFFYSSKVMVPLSFYILLFSLLYTYLSSKEADQAYGDFKAYKKLKYDYDLTLLFVLQYASTLTLYFKDKLYTYLENKIPIQHNLIDISFFQILLEDNLYENNEIDFFLYERVYYYVKYPNRFRSLCSNLVYLDLCQLIIFYLDKLNFKDQAITLANILTDTINNSKLKEKPKTYLVKQTNHLLNLSDESTYINDPKNIDRGMLSFILLSIPPYIQAEQEKNKGYEKFPLKTLI